MPLSRTLALVLLLLLVGESRAQSAADSIYDRVDIAPALLPDASTALDYLRLHTRHPDGDRQNGKVFVQVVIDTSGAVSDATVARGVSVDHDAEALRVVRMLRYAPAQADGRAVRTRAMVPVAFDSAFAAPPSFDAQTYPLPDVAARLLPNDQIATRAMMEAIGQMVAEQKPRGEGQIVVGFEVGRHGRVVAPRVLKSVSPLADSIALEAVKQTLGFMPARLDDQPIASYRTLPIRFQGVDPPPDPEPDVYKDGAVDVKPKLLPDDRSAIMGMHRRINYPEASKLAGVHGVVLVGFVVDEGGNVTDVHVLESVDPMLDREAVRGISSLRFSPGIQRGEARESGNDYARHVSTAIILLMANLLNSAGTADAHSVGRSHVRPRRFASH